MRLTTRLMQVASWLLVQRAVAEGEMSLDEAAKEKYRLGAREICRGKRMETVELLPPKLVDLLTAACNSTNASNASTNCFTAKSPRWFPACTPNSTASKPPSARCSKSAA